MKIEGNYTFDAPRDLVWEMFLDPAVLARIMPGCERLEQVGENRFVGDMVVRIGPVQGAFQGTVQLSNLAPPNGYHMTVNGKGPAGFVNGEGEVQLEEAEDGTIMVYSGNAQVGGRLAQVGQRLTDSSARAIIRQSLDNLALQIEARKQAGAPQVNGDGATPVAGPAAPSQTEFALGIAREMAGDLIASENRDEIAATGLKLLGGLLVLRLFAHWWANLLAKKIAEQIKESG